MTRVLFHVQHLLGIGHWRRAEALIRAMEGNGLSVSVATGEGTVQHVPAFAEPIALPDVRSADEAFSALVDAAGNPAGEALWTRRREILLAAVDRLSPDVLLVEGFPFARRRFRTELLPLIEQARSKNARIVSSVRDILQPKAESRRRNETAQWCDALFDLVLVHGDPCLATLDLSFPEAQRLRTPVAYTGYVSGPDAGEPDAPIMPGPRPVILVSAGGGAVGGALYAAAIAASALPEGAMFNWHVLVGQNYSGAGMESVPARDNLLVEPARADFPAVLGRAALSVSQAGYNTVVDLFRARTPSILVPFARGGQLEQSLRAGRLSRFQDFAVLEEATLTPEGLVEMARDMLTKKAAAAGAPCLPAVDTNGAQRSAAILRCLAERGVDDAAQLGLG